MPRTNDLRDHADRIGAPELEQYLTPSQIAAAWQVHENTIRRIFIDEPGVLRLAVPRRGKRSYVTLRIPPSTLRRVEAERSK